METISTKTKLAALATSALSAAVVLIAMGTAPESSAGNPPAAKSVTKRVADAKAAIARGEYLVTVGGCNDCHTPFKMGPNGPEPDMSRMLSGHPQDMKMPPAPGPNGPWLWSGAATNTAFAGPWGVSYAMNLTPDPKTGVAGVWTKEMFFSAIRTGKHWGTGRPILPPMPWFNYRHMTDEDLSAVWEYLRSIPPVENQIPASEPAI